ncbi:hypothetical protein [Salinirubrum litoreum]|uniref:Lipoprotein n=1 Tax=Salinirubrum litoreum TaxID=1126234 RepID=A0ABD5R8F6_9EURY|nr:hypothetical protein [Salinirubrum litoreum]
MPSRRRLLTALATSTTVALAGCAGSGSSGTARHCGSGFGDRATGDLFSITGPGVDPEDDGVVLLVALTEAAIRDTGVRRVEFRTSEGRIVHELPVAPGGGRSAPTGKYPAENVRVFRTYLGPYPQTGVFRVVAVDDTDETVDAVTMDYDCYRTESDGGSVAVSSNASDG